LISSSVLDLSQSWYSSLASTETFKLNFGRTLFDQTTFTQKQSGFHFKSEIFYNFSFHLEDMFNQYATVKLLKNESLYSIKNVSSVFYGRCYTIESKVKLILFKKYSQTCEQRPPLGQKNMSLEKNYQQMLMS
jgi:hypothetical protein